MFKKNKPTSLPNFACTDGIAGASGMGFHSNDVNSCRTPLRASPKPKLLRQKSIIPSVALERLRSRRKKEKKQKSLVAVTQCHANILNLPQAQTGKSKVFWTFVVVVAITGLTYTLLHVMHRYVKSPKASEITVESLSHLTFPAVVVCSLNPLNRTYLQANNIDSSLAKYMQSVYIFMKNDASTLQQINGTNSTKYNAQVQKLVAKYPDHDLRRFFFDAGYECEQFLEACAFEWRGFNCCDKAVPIFDIQFGKCYMFDRGSFTQHYPSAGLQLKLRIDREILSPQFGPPSRGIALRLQPEYDASATESIYMGMGVHAAVQVEEFHQEYLNTPFRRRVCHPQHEMGGTWTDMTTANYTQNQCIGVCFNQRALEVCNCTYPQDARLFDRRPGSRICTPSETISCLQRHVENHDIPHECAQNCLPECYQTQFRTSVSTADLVPVSWDDHGPAQAVDNRLIMDIFFAKIQRTNVREIYIVTADGLISQIGGLLGIFLGASMITAVQLVMYWLKLCVHCIKRLNRRRKKYVAALKRPKSLNLSGTVRNGVYSQSIHDSPVNCMTRCDPDANHTDIC